MPEAGHAAGDRGTWLGFDFGLRRIGVAAGQTATRTAGALTTIRNAGDPDWRAIGRLLTDWRPRGVVVGLPLDAEGQETDMSRAARDFGRALAERFGLDVRFADERLSSREAVARFAELRAGGAARRKDSDRVDAMAAKIILENWLQSRPG